jgi:flagellar protein FliJ
MSDANAPRRSTSGRDRGLVAVARVREVRERDSRAGLLQALANVRTREAELAERQQALADASARSFSSLGEFTVGRHFLDATASAVTDAQRRLTASTTVATEARSRWQADKTRARAIEHLLEQRAERARTEALRSEAREIDDIVGGRRVAADGPGRHGGHGGHGGHGEGGQA